MLKILILSVCACVIHSFDVYDYFERSPAYRGLAKNLGSSGTGATKEKRPYWWEGSTNPFKSCDPSRPGCLDGSAPASSFNVPDQEIIEVHELPAQSHSEHNQYDPINSAPNVGVVHLEHDDDLLLQEPGLNFETPDGSLSQPEIIHVEEHIADPGLCPPGTPNCGTYDTGSDLVVNVIDDGTYRDPQGKESPLNFPTHSLPNRDPNLDVSLPSQNVQLSGSPIPEGAEVHVSEDLGSHSSGDDQFGQPFNQADQFDVRNGGENPQSVSPGDRRSLSRPSYGKSAEKLPSWDSSNFDNQGSGSLHSGSQTCPPCPCQVPSGGSQRPPSHGSRPHSQQGFPSQSQQHSGFQSGSPRPQSISFQNSGQPQRPYQDRPGSSQGRPQLTSRPQGRPSSAGRRPSERPQQGSQQPHRTQNGGNYQPGSPQSGRPRPQSGQPQQSRPRPQGRPRPQNGGSYQPDSTQGRPRPQSRPQARPRPQSRPRPQNGGSYQPGSQSGTGAPQSGFGLPSSGSSPHSSGSFPQRPQGSRPQSRPQGRPQRPHGGSQQPHGGSNFQQSGQDVPYDGVNTNFQRQPVDGLPFKQNEINPNDLRPISTGVSFSGMPMMMMPPGMPLIGGSCSAGSYCVEANTCNPYTGFIIRDINQIAAALPDSPQVPLVECFIPAGSVTDGVCCQEPHPLAGGAD